jgi:hypothetical protein
MDAIMFRVTLSPAPVGSPYKKSHHGNLSRVFLKDIVLDAQNACQSRAIGQRLFYPLPDSGERSKI